LSMNFFFNVRIFPAQKEMVSCLKSKKTMTEREVREG